ncbi:MAG: DNA gyrase subunit A [Deferribacterota bacterium]|nr:DNA gyrase subunit A [Deferribacterota bacterium]
MSKNIINIQLEESIRKDYLDYAMSVIISRALPDVRDGLKPVHRRILYAMHKMGLHYNKPFRKSARIVGEVIGKYHPHGDTSVYDALVRLAQDFLMRYSLVDGQGNFGSIDDDPPAAMRYTEARLTKIAEYCLADIEKDTVDFIPNYDGSESEPIVLPTKVPNLLINGCSGIAVGMSTEIPPHNLGEIIDALICLIDNPEITLDDILNIIKGPDYPTAGEIISPESIRELYETGKGSLLLRGKASIENNGKEQIIITELPYKVNKSKLIEDIARLVNEKKITGISDLRDESDRDGIRVVVDIKKGENSEVILNKLYKETKLEEKQHYQFIAIEEGKPKTFNLIKLLNSFINYRIQIVVRRTKYLLKKANETLHILEGLIKALENIDYVINIIKNSKNPDEAARKLMENLELDSKQTDAILKMQLQKLTSLEVSNIRREFQETKEKIDYYNEILTNNGVLMSLIKEELLEVKSQFADKRRTLIIDGAKEINEIDLIPNVEKIVILSRSGYIKRMEKNDIRKQKRGGSGKHGANYRDDDFVKLSIVAKNHDNIMFFTNRGKVYYLKAYQIPEVNWSSKGGYVGNLIEFSANEKIQSMLNVSKDIKDSYIFFVTKFGIVKKSSVTHFRTLRSGVIATRLRENDEIISTYIVREDRKVIIATKKGKSINFKANTLSDIGRNAIGVIGIRLDEDDEVISSFPLYDEDYILTVTSKGYGKLSNINEYRCQQRGGKGIKICKISGKTGDLVSANPVGLDNEVILSTKKGKNIKIAIKDISILSRGSQGVKLITLKDDEVITTTIV